MKDLILSLLGGLVQTGNQYRDDIFDKLLFNFEEEKKLLDIGCGEGRDLRVFRDYFELEVYGVDVYRSDNLKGVNFKIGSICKIPHKNDFFDYVFLHDVLHHIDEPQQRHAKHVEGLKEARRVCKKGGTIIIVEANRYNPLSYFHMVLLQGHAHFTQSYFRKLISSVFRDVEFKAFEAHFYPQKYLKIFKVYERVMEELPWLKSFLSYNVAIVKNGE